jgi:hypothetical protein
MDNQNKLAGYATLFGAMLLTIAISMAFFMVKGVVPPFFLIVLPAIVGVGLLTAGLASAQEG